MSKFEIKLLADCSEFIHDLSTLWYSEIGKKWLPNSNVTQAEQTFRTHLNKKDLPLTCVALHENKLIGTASLRENDGIRADLAPWLGSLIVHPEYRRQKVGETLIGAVKQKAKEMGHQKLYLFTLDSTIPKWYAQLGWRLVSHEYFYQHPAVVMDIEI